MHGGAVGDIETLDGVGVLENSALENEFHLGGLDSGVGFASGLDVGHGAGGVDLNVEAFLHGLFDVDLDDISHYQLYYYLL